MKKRIYMDNHATTPLDPEALDAMMPYLTEKFGNASSRSHSFGWEAQEAVDRAREQLAALVGAKSSELHFTSGATESDNLAILGVADACADRGDQVVTVRTEHPAVLDSCARLERLGKRVTYIPVDRDGLVELDRVREALTDRTVLVSVMYAHNEIGVIQPIREIGALCRERGILFHSDATQAVGRIPVAVEKDNIDLMSLTGHKMYGPKGVGALYVRSRPPRIRLTPMLFGGGQEGGVRSGTLNVPGIVGFGAAAEVARRTLAEEAPRLLALRERLRKGLEESLDGTELNGHLEKRLPGNLSMNFLRVESQALLASLEGIALSAGSACSSGAPKSSATLKALGRSDAAALGSVRFGLGRFNTEQEVDFVLEKLVAAVKRLRGR